MTTTYIPNLEEAAGVGALRDLLDGEVVTPAEPDWDEARRAWNLAADQRPAAVVYAESAADVVAVVELRPRPRPLRDHAGHRALRQHPRRLRGHHPGQDLPDARPRDRPRDADRPRRGGRHSGKRSAWPPPSTGSPASRAPLTTSASSATHLAAVSAGSPAGTASPPNSVVAVEARRPPTAARYAPTGDNEPELFWAIRGGGGSFGIVTAIEFALYPVPEVYAGVLFFPFERAAEVLKAWRALGGRHARRGHLRRPADAVPGLPGDPRAAPRQVLRRCRGRLTSAPRRTARR